MHTPLTRHAGLVHVRNTAGQLGRILIDSSYSHITSYSAAEKWLLLAFSRISDVFHHQIAGSESFQILGVGVRRVAEEVRRVEGHTGL